jgi:nucleoside phosphorylase
MVEQATRLNPKPIFNIGSAGSMEKSLTVVMTGWREKTWTQSSKNTREVIRRASA